MTAVVELASTDAARLTELEGIVDRGLATFVEVGTALYEINTSRLYRATHATFAEYVGDRFGIGKSHAYRMIDAAKIADVVSPMGDIRTERQARALKGAPPNIAQTSVAVAQGMAKLLRGPEAEPTAEEIATAREHVSSAPPRVVDEITPDKARDLTARIVGSVGDLPDDESWAATIEAELRASDPDYRETAHAVTDGAPSSSPVPTPAPKTERRPDLHTTARALTTDLGRIVNRLVKLREDNRFSRNTEQVASLMRGDLSDAIEVCQDLLDAFPSN